MSPRPSMVPVSAELAWQLRRTKGAPYPIRRKDGVWYVNARKLAEWQRRESPQ